ncbi:hypothetical protein [Mannheimia haemolytica]
MENIPTLKTKKILNKNIDLEESAAGDPGTSNNAINVIDIITAI